MASSSSSLHFLLLSFLFISLSTTPQSSDALLLPISKDARTLQYLTLIHQGTPLSLTTLVVDLGGSSLWMDCDSSSSSSSYQPARCRSIQCSTGNANKCQTSFNHQKTTSCGLPAKNTITGITMTGELGEDVVTIQSMATIHNFLFSCAPAFLSKGLPTGVKGMVGLGRNRISLPSQFAGAFGFDRKFSICLPSSTNSKGVIFLDTASHSSLTTNKLAEVSRSMMYTPLITNTQEDFSDEYYIGVKSIQINSKELVLNTQLLSINDDGVGGTRLSTVAPYTTLETSIYNALTKAFTEAAISLSNMTRVASVAPFEVCFSSKDKRFVPNIDLVLQSNMVKWRIYGANSMVQISDKVMCLGFLDGGLNARSSVVIGGYQLEDNLIEFDLASSRMGFTSLFERQIQCSELNLDGESSRSS